MNAALTLIPVEVEDVAQNITMITATAGGVFGRHEGLAATYAGARGVLRREGGARGGGIGFVTAATACAERGRNVVGTGGGDGGRQKGW